MGHLLANRRTSAWERASARDGEMKSQTRRRDGGATTGVRAPRPVWRFVPLVDFQ
jgi:hypothetical protein